MDRIIAAILEIINDYHRYNGFQFTTDRISQWVSQFEENDQQFILEEFLHLLQKGIYISETKARELLLGRIESLCAKYKYPNVPAFLANIELLRIQAKGKSQDVLLGLLDEELVKKYGMGLSLCDTAAQKYALYIDDTLATGNTVFRDSLAWLKSPAADGETNLAKVIKKEKILIVSLFCLHTAPNVPWRLRSELDNEQILNKIQFLSDYEVQNHPARFDQRLNFAYPVADQPIYVKEYFETLTGKTNEKTAFRKDNVPVKEVFFSSPANRIRFENILLHKGIYLLARASTLKTNHRPLGATFPSHKTLGTGTLFFTWRNISNTCPIVFWWEAGGWLSFFPLFRRGLAGTTFAP